MENLQEFIKSVNKYVCYNSENCNDGISHINPGKDVIAKFGGKVTIWELVSDKRSVMVLIGLKKKLGIGETTTYEDLDFNQPISILTFDDTKSIDMVIKVLNDMKKSMIKLKEKEETK